MKKNNITKIIGIEGCRGSGKTITIFIIGKILSRENKVLIIADKIKINNKINKIKNEKIKLSKIDNNLFILNNYPKIINDINLIKEDFNYIFIEIKNKHEYIFFKTLLNENIIILNPNMIDISKTKRIINFINKNNKFKILLNNYNKNSISEKIINKIFKIKIIGKIKNNKNYNLIINNNFNLNLINKKIEKNIKNIVNKI